MKTHTNRTGENNQDGIALIIVLGLLAVLVIIGVSFSVSMRTERLATRSYLDVVKARHLVHTALARVLSEHIHPALDGLAYPPWDAYSIPDTTADRLEILGDKSMTNSPMIFIPMSLRSAAAAAEGLQWQELRDPYDDKILYGEYAFLVVNNSGLLDANVIGSTNMLRSLGTNAAEIIADYNVLPELMSGAPSNALAKYREGFARFESVPELYNLTSSTMFSGNFGAPPLVQKGSGSHLAGRMADHLHVFSRLPLGFANDNLTANSKVAYIGGNPSASWLTGVVDAISDISVATIPDKLAFARVMYDFAESESYEPVGDNDTEKFARISSRPVPMINEIIVSNSLKMVMSGTQATVEHRIYLTIETWFPFTADDDEPAFQIRLDAPLQKTAIIPNWPGFQAQPTLEKSPDPASFGPDPDKDSGYNLTTFVYIQKQDVNGPGQPSYGPGTMTLRVTLPAAIRVVHVSTDKTVDLVFPGWASDAFQLGGFRPANLPIDQERGIAVVGKSVNDPRINWAPANPIHWGNGSATITPMARNVTVAGERDDEVGFMYARREPFSTVGDIGYLLYNETKPWQTVRLIDPPVPEIAKLIDRFRVHADGEYPRLGVVNVNTRQEAALAAVFNQSPIERYPGDPNKTRMTPTQAKELAKYWVSVVGNVGMATNTSDYATRVTAAKFDQILGTSDKFTRESVIRNSIGLLGARHNLFTIFLAARTFSDKYNPAAHSNVKRDYVTSEQRAVAVVWRDPYITTDGAGNSTAESWVQYFHWFTQFREN